MLAEAIKQIKIAFILLILFSILTGLIYPAVVTGVAQVFFPSQANGSLIVQNGKTIGSVLIGQSFDQAKYFWSRPSATTPFAYNAESSNGSNLGPSNPDLIAAVKARAENLHLADPKNINLIPIELVTSSASGLDPEISPAAAKYQIHRIANERHLSEKVIDDLIHHFTQDRTFGVLGEPRLNVLELNLALDNLPPPPSKG